MRLIPPNKNVDRAIAHYGLSLRINSTAVQAANSRILELRNAHAINLIMPTKLRLRALQTVAGTAQENSLDVYKVTSFSVLDTTNTVTPTKSAMRTNMTVFPGGAEIRHLTLAGNIAGMTGGTMTKDAQAIATLPYNVEAAIALRTPWTLENALPAEDDAHPLVLQNNEGIVIESRVLNVTTLGITWYIDLFWAELGTF